MSCHGHRQRREWQKQTWLPQLTEDYRFFLGHAATKEEPGEDVVILDCKDNYISLPDKTFKMIQWAKDHGYTKILKIDDDVYCRPERLEIPDADYVGHAYGHKLYASGAAYWLSHRSIDAILTKFYRRTNAEDACIGETLKIHGITLTEDHRYRVGWANFPKHIGENEFPHPENDTITFHMYFPEFMVEMHNNWDKKKQLVTRTEFNSLTKR